MPTASISPTKSGEVEVAPWSDEISSRAPRASRSNPYQHILVALDGSELGEQILPYVEALARKFSSKITLLHAVMALEVAIMAEHASLKRRVPPRAPDADSGTEVLTDPITYLESIEDRMRTAGFDVERECPEGRYAEVIAKRARDLGADVIAMTTHGRGGLRRAIMGSVADEVLRTAPCPVLLVRSKEEA